MRLNRGGTYSPLPQNGRRDQGRQLVSQTIFEEEAWEVGDVAEVEWEGQWYRAELREQHDDDTWNVFFDHDESCADVAASRIRRLQAEHTDDFGKQKSALLPILIVFAVLGVANAILIFGFNPTFHDPDDPDKELSWEPYAVLNAVLLSIYLMASGLPADLVLMAVSGIFCTFRIITVKDLLEGLANSGVVAVAVLCVVSKAIDKTKALNGLMGGCLGEPTSTPVAMFRLAVPVVSLGTVFNNTPLVAVMIPIVKEWCGRTGLEVSQFMMPLSFITMLSACITTMGSSTNLLAVQLVPEADIRFLDPAPVGLVVMVVGVAYCCLAAPFLLPKTTEEARTPMRSENGPVLQADEETCQTPRDLSENPGSGRYTVVFKLGKNGPLLSHNAEDAGLISCLPAPANVFCLRGAEKQAILATGDEFACQNATAEDIANLQAVPGLELQALGSKFMTEQHQADRRKTFQVEAQRQKLFAMPVRKWVAANVAGGWVPHQRALYEVVIPPGGLIKAGRTSRVMNSTPQDLQQPLSDWNCTLIAVRGYSSHSAKCPQLSGGEVLLVEALTAGFSQDSARAFSMMRPVLEGHPPSQLNLSPLDACRPVLAVLGLAVCVVLSALEIAPLDSVALLVSLLSIVMGTLSSSDMYGAINGPVLLTVAASFGVGAAFSKTGLASALAKGVLGVAEQGGPYMILGSIVSLALVLGVVVSNNTTVILLAPLVQDICKRQDMELKMVMLAVVYAANLSFATPFSYQTNMMVMPHGKYVFMDYVRFGVPMMILCGVVALVGTYSYWG